MLHDQHLSQTLSFWLEYGCLIQAPQDKARLRKSAYVIIQAEHITCGPCSVSSWKGSPTLWFSARALARLTNSS